MECCTFVDSKVSWVIGFPYTFLIFSDWESYLSALNGTTQGILGTSLFQLFWHFFQYAAMLKGKRVTMQQIRPMQ